MRLRSLRSCVAAVLAVCTLSACAGRTSDAQHSIAASNLQLGLSYAQQGNYEIALDKLQRSLDADDQNASAHLTIAYVYQQTGDRRLADRHYRKAVVLAPEDASIRNNYGVFLCSGKKFKDAERHLLQAAKNPRYATPEVAWTNAGVCLKRHDPAKAESYLRKALSLKPAYREALAQMAELSFARADYLRTRAFLQRYDLGRSANAELLSIAAQTEAKLGDAVAARRFQQRLRSEFPEYSATAKDEESPQ